MAEFGLIKSFNIDHGELDGLTPQHVFCLGYELAQIDSLVKNAAGFARHVHAENKERVEQSCRDAGREFTLTYMDNDPSESWMWLMVQDRDDTGDLGCGGEGSQ